MKRIPRLPEPLEVDVTARDLLALQRALDQFTARVHGSGKAQAQHQPPRRRKPNSSMPGGHGL